MKLASSQISFAFDFINNILVLKVSNLALLIDSVPALIVTPAIIKSYLDSYSWTTWWEQSGSYYSRDDRDTQLQQGIAAGMVHRFQIIQNGNPAWFIVNAIGVEYYPNSQDKALKIFLNGNYHYQVWINTGTGANKDAHLTVGSYASEGYIIIHNVDTFISIDMHENVYIK